jgi:hypothetical protein
MIQSKTIVTIGVFAVFCVIGIYIAFRTSSTAPIAPQTITPSPVQMTTPAIARLPSPPLGLPSVRYNTMATPSSIPTSLAAYEYTQEQSPQTVATQLASLFSFSGAPSTSQAPQGTYYRWSSGESGLLIKPGATHIIYSSPHPPLSGTLTATDEEFIALAQGLAASISTGVTLSQPRIRYYTTTSDRINYTGRPSARAIELTFTYLLEGQRLFSDQPQVSQVLVRFDNTKTLRYFSAPVYRQLRKTSQVVPLPTSQIINQKLLQGNGILYHALSEADISEPDTKFYSFSSVEVQQINAGYYLNIDQQKITPVAVITGSAVDQTTKKTIETLTLMSL